MINFSVQALLERSIPHDHHFRMWGVPVLSAKWEDTFGIPMIAWWGMTETVTHGVVSEIQGRRRPKMVGRPATRSEEHTSELQSLMRISYAVFCLQKKKKEKIK